MAKKEEQKERRRFEEKDRKPWTDEQRKQYETARTRLAPIVRDLTTPPREDKKEESNWLDDMFGVTK